jgi:hypothetical protein
MSPASRQRLLAAALLATLVAAWLAPERPDDDGATVAALAPMPDLRDWPAAPEMPVARPPQAGTANTVDSTPQRSTRRPQAERSSSTGSLADSPPAPPFRVFGQLERDGEAVAFISHAGRTLTVSAGDRLPGGWQVDAVGSEGVVLTYLPLGQTALIPFKAPAK